MNAIVHQVANWSADWQIAREGLIPAWKVIAAEVESDAIVCVSGLTTDNLGEEKDLKWEGRVLSDVVLSELVVKPLMRHLKPVISLVVSAELFILEVEWNWQHVEAVDSQVGVSDVRTNRCVIFEW